MEFLLELLPHYRVSWELVFEGEYWIKDTSKLFVQGFSTFLDAAIKKYYPH
jgi:hypothetical protein